jgi:hypothetical protein
MDPELLTGQRLVGSGVHGINRPFQIPPFGAGVEQSQDDMI